MGHWKTLLRVHDGNMLTAVPIYLAADPGIGAKEVPALRRRRHDRSSRRSRILQRERSPDDPRCCGSVGCLVVLVCTLILIGALDLGRGPYQQKRGQRQRGRVPSPRAQA